MWLFLVLVLVGVVKYPERRKRAAHCLSPVSHSLSGTLCVPHASSKRQSTRTTASGTHNHLLLWASILLINILGWARNNWQQSRGLGQVCSVQLAVGCRLLASSAKREEQQRRAAVSCQWPLARRPTLRTAPIFTLSVSSLGQASLERLALWLGAAGKCSRPTACCRPGGLAIGRSRAANTNKPDRENKLATN